MLSHGPTSTSLEIDAPPTAVFAVISDASTYPEWLVGAQRIRSVDPAWPAAGSSFHHTIGFGPVRLNDSTESLEIDPPHHLRLRAGMSVLGAAIVTFEVTETASGSRLTLTEGPDRGPFRALFHLTLPITRPLLWGRNAISLDHVRDLVTARASTPLN